MPTEADTCRKFVVPKLQASGWDNEPHFIAEQRTITDGRIIPAGKGFIRKPPKRVDYLLRYARDFPLAFVVVAANVATWIVFSRDSFDWHAVATVATCVMTLFIQRAEHRDTQAI